MSKLNYGIGIITEKYNQNITIMYSDTDVCIEIENDSGKLDLKLSHLEATDLAEEIISLLDYRSKNSEK